jgi:NAD(P)-dependent dehydrogenase (short-subunit alcohol dehydrogenase family)
VDGSPVAASDEPSGPSTAERIVAGGGRAQASGASVTDIDAVRELFGDLVAEHGRLDAVVNVAGIARPTGFASGSDDDWAAVLSVHLDGYRNVLDAALPLMAEAGSGRIVGVTSGSGWRPADAGAYSCAKRAVASLTWQLGAAAPPGVAVNAISPIALTRMVTAALARATRGPSPGGAAGGPSLGGLSLGGMASPESLGPLGAHLASVGATSLRGQILFAGGSEVALVRPPRLIEVVRTPRSPDAARVVDAVIGSWIAAEARQASTGGANPRFGGLYDSVASVGSVGSVASVGSVVSTAADGPHGPDGFDGPHTPRARRRRRRARAPRCEPRSSALGAAVQIAPPPPDTGIAALRTLLGRADAHLGGIDAVIVDSVIVDSAIVDSGNGAGNANATWATILADHDGLSGRIAHDARWARTVAEHASTTGRPVRLVTLVDAASPSGRSRAQAAAQLARAGSGATEGRVTAVAVSVEDRAQGPAVAALAALLALDERAVGLGGAELAVGSGWIGLRAHPTPAGSLVFGGPEIPPWFDDALREIAGVEAAP